MIVNKRYSLVRREMIKLCTFLSVPWEFDVNLVMVTNFFSYVSVFDSCSEYNDCHIFGFKFTGWTHRRKGKHFNELRSRTRALGEISTSAQALINRSFVASSPRTVYLTVRLSLLTRGWLWGSPRFLLPS